MKVLEWPSQNLDLNPIDSLWTELEKYVQADPTELQQLCQQERANIPAKYCEKLVEGYLKCLIQVKKLKDNTTKY